MDSILIKYEEVYANTTELREHITENVIANAEKEYNRIKQMLEQTDGATNAELINTVEQNRNKTVSAAKVLDKLLSFMNNSTKQVEINEQKMSRDIFPG